jgi:aldose sugar dehydrogenase
MALLTVCVKCGRTIDVSSYKSILAISLHLVILVLISGYHNSFDSYALVKQSVTKESLPVMNDDSLSVELISEGIQFPTDMAFLATNDILVLEKNNGTVKRIVNGTVLPEPILDVNVANSKERGMLGIAIAANSGVNNSSAFVFLYFTESPTSDDDSCPPPDYYCKEGHEPLGNNLYRYELKGRKLMNPYLLLKLPASPGPTHNGGKVTIGPDHNIYIAIGDVGGHKTKAQNFRDGTPPDGTSGILRITQEGQVPIAGVNISADGKMSPYYYAYGIRNSFGLDFDPVTSRLWDTENGPEYGDEINLVEPGFNSGWAKIQGLWEPIEGNSLLDFVPGNMTAFPSNLESFGKKGKYSGPEFIWNETVAPTALKFINSDKLGDRYKNDLLVGDSKRGQIYHFDLSQNRTQLKLGGILSDKIANNMDELKGVILAKGFGGISDIELGPDGYIYVLSYEKNIPNKGYGSVFRIVPDLDEENR